MCTPSSKLKLCTCAPASINKLKHYWELHSAKEKSIILIGEIVIDFSITTEKDLENIKLLSNRLNEPEAFDVDLEPLEGDHLLLSFGCGPGPMDQLQYGFKYEDGKWLETPYSFQKWFNTFEHVSTGKIKDALVHTKSH